MSESTIPDAASDGKLRDDVKPTAAFSFNDYLENDVIAASLQGEWTDVSFLLDALKEQGLLIHTLDELNSFMEKNPQVFREYDGRPGHWNIARHWRAYLDEASPPQPLSLPREMWIVAPRTLTNRIKAIARGIDRIVRDAREHGLADHDAKCIEKLCDKLSHIFPIET